MTKLPIDLPPQLAAICQDADHIDLKTVSAPVALPAFLAGLFSFYPGWVKLLYRVRWVFVRLLGMRQTGVPQARSLQAQDVPMRAGARMSFFMVEAAEEQRLWVGRASEAHLTARLAVLANPVGSTGVNRFTVVTIVHYHNWAGPVYFQIIRPFHHLVVNAMIRSGASATPPGQASEIQRN